MDCIGDLTIVSMFNRISLGWVISLRHLLHLDSSCCCQFHAWEMFLWEEGDCCQMSLYQSGKESVCSSCKVSKETTLIAWQRFFWTGQTKNCTILSMLAGWVVRHLTCLTLAKTTSRGRASHFPGRARSLTTSRGRVFLSFHVFLWPDPVFLCVPVLVFRGWVTIKVQIPRVGEIYPHSTHHPVGVQWMFGCSGIWTYTLSSVAMNGQ